MHGEKPPPAPQSMEPVTEPEIHGEVSTEDVGSSLADGSVFCFYDVEQRACERFQDVVRMIDDRLKI